jgi:hypothetical protein
VSYLYSFETCQVPFRHHLNTFQMALALVLNPDTSLLMSSLRPASLLRQRFEVASLAAGYATCSPDDMGVQSHRRDHHIRWSVARFWSGLQNVFDPEYRIVVDLLVTYPTVVHLS